MSSWICLTLGIQTLPKIRFIDSSKIPIPLNRIVDIIAPLGHTKRIRSRWDFSWRCTNLFEPQLPTHEFAWDFNVMFVGFWHPQTQSKQSEPFRVRRKYRGDLGTGINQVTSNWRRSEREGSNLVGGWTNPFEKYARQIGSFPQVGMKIKNVWNHQPEDVLAGAKLPCPIAHALGPASREKWPSQKLISSSLSH